jgi:hypothetical protein
MEEGLRAELEIDIAEKLERKEEELKRMQEVRWQWEKQEAMRQFQEKVEMRMQESPMELLQREEDPVARHYNN